MKKSPAEPVGLQAIESAVIYWPESEKSHSPTSKYGKHGFLQENQEYSLVMPSILESRSLVKQYLFMGLSVVLISQVPVDSTPPPHLA
jgi:hypothetical protein